MTQLMTYHISSFTHLQYDATPNQRLCIVILTPTYYNQTKSEQHSPLQTRSENFSWKVDQNHMVDSLFSKVQTKSGGCIQKHTDLSEFFCLVDKNHILTDLLFT